MSLKITLEYIAETEFFNDKPLKFNDNLKNAIASVSEGNSGLHNYINEDLEEPLLTASSIVLKTDISSDRVLSVITYTTSIELSSSQLDTIVSATTSQLSDGYGEEPLEILLSNRLFLKKKIYIGLLQMSLQYPYKIETNYNGNINTIYQQVDCPLALLEAVSQGDLELVISLLKSEEVVNCTTTDGDSLLVYTITKKEEEIALYLIENGADISNIDMLFMHTVYAGSIKLSQFLLENGAAINKPLLNERPALLWAVNNIEMAKFLIQKGADANTQNDYQRSALSLSSNPDVVALLLENGANPNHISEEDKTPLDYLKEDLSYTDDARLSVNYKKIIALLKAHNK